ncbi:MAG: Ppx/GppA family phosphatase [Synergistaceae bacterium]|nr:Ppx/GppA family phosphatase [Synergistaceae bacterium]
MAGGKIPPRFGRAWRLKSVRDTKAVIDIGSNSIKLRVARKRGETIRTLVDTTEVVRLGQGLEQGLIDEKTMKYGVDVVWRLVRLAGEMGTRPRLVGTMALRAARNAEDFVRRVRERTGIAVEILSGEEEARLAWLGAIHGLSVKDKNEGDMAVFDTGGGSTEFILGSDSHIMESTSIPVGAVRLTEKFFDSDPVKPGSVESAREHIRGLFAAYGLFCRKFSPFVIGLGGGVTAIASVKLGLSSFSSEAINGVFLTRGDVDEQVERYASSTLAERMKIAGLPPKRADIVLGSACIVQCALDVLGVGSFQVSINGLRHGLLVEMFGGGR